MNFQAITSWIGLQVGVIIVSYFLGIGMPEWLKWSPTILFGIYLIISTLGWLLGILFGRPSKRRSDDY